MSTAATPLLWKVTCYRLTKTWSGEAPDVKSAQAAVQKKIDELGRGLQAISGVITRPGITGGWNARLAAKARTLTWERW